MRLPSPLFLLSVGVLTTNLLAAQTKPAATHRTTSTTHRPAAHTAPRSACAVLPALSPKIPALPPGTPCAKTLFTIAERLEDVSPLLSPEIRATFANLPVIFSLNYADIRLGTGELAKRNMYFTVKYTGYLTDGTKFDSSYDHPETLQGFNFPYGGHRVIPGWDLGFEGMRVGGKRRLYIPQQLAYGDRGQSTIPPRSELIFDMELVSQTATNPTPPPAPKSPVTPPPPPAGATPPPSNATPPPNATSPAGQPTTTPPPQ